MEIAAVLIAARIEASASAPGVTMATLVGIVVVALQLRQ